MILADLGADVVQVDRPGRIDRRRPSSDVTNRGKRPIVVDLKHPRGVEVVLRLAERSDVLHRGVPARCHRAAWHRACRLPGPEPGAGLRPDDRLGPGRTARGVGRADIAYIAITGALHAIGRAAARRRSRSTYLGDFGGGSMSRAWRPRGAPCGRVSGRGRVVDAAIVDGTAALQAMGYGLLADGAWTDARGVNLLDTGAPVLRRLRDRGRAAPGGRRPRAAVLRGLHRDALRAEGVPGDLPGQHDPAGWPELRSRFAARFRQRSQTMVIGLPRNRTRASRRSAP